MSAALSAPNGLHHPAAYVDVLEDAQCCVLPVRCPTGNCRHRPHTGFSTPATVVQKYGSRQRTQKGNREKQLLKLTLAPFAIFSSVPLRCNYP